MIEWQQIEEMAEAILRVNDNYDTTLRKDCETIAGLIYEAGYRKQSEGEWHYPPYAPFGGSYEMKRCSICGYKPDFDSDNPYTKFCPECGAKMKGR